MKIEKQRSKNFILAFNGAKIMDVRHKRCIYERTLPAHIPSRLWKDATQKGLGVAMANGQKEVKDAANYITENDNDHDGIAEVIERFFPTDAKLGYRCSSSFRSEEPLSH